MRPLTERNAASGAAPQTVCQVLAYNAGREAA